MSSENPLERIVFVSIPQDIKRSFGDFTLDPTKLIPVEMAPGATGLDAQDLSWEMIVSGMLKILALQPDHDDADYFRRFVLAIRPDIEKEMTQAAIAKAELHDFTLAEELFTAMAGLFPQKSRHALNLALVREQRALNYRQLGKEELADLWEDRAAETYARTLAMDEPVPEAYLYAGHFFLRTHDVERSLDLFRHFLEIEPEHPEVERVSRIVGELERTNLNDLRFKEAFDFIRMNQEERGLASIDLFLESNPEVWNAHFIRGWALRRLERWDEGVEAFSEAIRLGGGNADTLNELSICLMETGDFKAAGNALEQALRLDPENTKIVSNMGILALKRGDKAEARRFFGTVLAFDPEDPIARNYMEHLEEGEA